MNLWKSLLRIVGCIALGAGVLTATPLTFAQFFEATGTNDFVFADDGNGTATFTANSAVYLTFFSANLPADRLFQALPSGPVLATLTRTGTATTAAVCSGSCVAGSAVTQALTNSQLIIRRQSDGALLLESTGTGAALSGWIGGSTASFQNSNPPNNLVFTSDFVNFSAADTSGGSLSFSSLSPGLSVGPDGLLNSFTAAASGTFSTDFTDLASASVSAESAAPEPGTTILVALGFVLIAVKSLRRKNHK